MNDDELALMHANGQPAPDLEHAQRLYRDLDEVIALLSTPLYAEPEQALPPDQQR